MYLCGSLTSCDGPPGSQQKTCLVQRLIHVYSRVLISQLNDEAAEQALQVEQHFIGRRKPVYARRNQVIKGLDKFWQISLSQHPALKDAMTTHDYTILGYCTEVRATSECGTVRGIQGEVQHDMEGGQG